MIEETYDPTDDKHVAIAEKIQEDRRKSELRDIQLLLQTNQGRRFFWRYLGVCGVFRSSMTGNNTTFFNEGKREIGLMLLSDMNEAAPEAYAIMQREEAERQANEQVKFEKELKNV